MIKKIDKSKPNAIITNSLNKLSKISISKPQNSIPMRNKAMNN
jgi:hypothetical protein